MNQFCAQTCISSAHLKPTVVDDFSYVMLEQAKKVGELSVDTSKYNMETSHMQHLKQQWRVWLTFTTYIQGN